MTYRPTEADLAATWVRVKPAEFEQPGCTHRLTQVWTHGGEPWVSYVVDIPGTTMQGLGSAAWSHFVQTRRRT